MDWSRQKKYKVPVPKRKLKLAPVASPSSSSFSNGNAPSKPRSRSNSFVLSKIFDETIELESRSKNIPLESGQRRSSDDLIQLHEVSYEFGSEWLGKSPPEKSISQAAARPKVPPTLHHLQLRRDSSQAASSIAHIAAEERRERRKLAMALPPLPSGKSKGKGVKTMPRSTGTPTTPRAQIARRISSLPKPIEQKSSPPSHGVKGIHKDVQTQTEKNGNGVGDGNSFSIATSVQQQQHGGPHMRKHPLVPAQGMLQDIRICGDLLQEMIYEAVALGEIYQKERKRGKSRQKGSCCVIC